MNEREFGQQNVNQMDLNEARDKWSIGENCRLPLPTGEEHVRETTCATSPTSTSEFEMDDRNTFPGEEASTNKTCESSFGLGPFRCSSSLVTINLFAVVLCVTVFFESFCTNGVNPTNYQSLETRFSFSSTTSGIISIMYDVAYCLIAVPFSYLGTKYLTKPKWMAIGFTTVSVACVTMAMPQFISGVYHVNSEGDLNTCDGNRTQLYCDVISQTQDESAVYPVVLSVGNFLFGCGTVAQNTLAVHYFEENSAGNSGFYYGIMQATRSLGSIMGAGLNAVFLTVPVDLEELPVDNSHVLWVGAWWVGLCIGAVGVILCVPLVLSFPLKFNNQYTRNTVSRTENQSQSIPFSSSAKAKEDIQVSVGNLKSQLSAVVCNLPWILFTLAAVPEAFIYSGLVTFGAKFFQQSLAMTSSGAAITFASVIVLGTLGSIVGALISRKMNSLRGIIKTLMTVTLLEMILSSSILLHCPEQSVSNVPGATTEESISSMLESGKVCFDKCQCSVSLFQPVCHEASETTLFNACYAGCEGDKTDCSCVGAVSHGHESSLNRSYLGENVEEGFCAIDCPEKYFAAIGLGFFCFAMLIKVPIGLSGNLKLISSPHLASLSLAVSNIAFRVLGMSTGPLVFGAIMDANCDLWEVTCDEGQGSCLLYSLDKLSFTTFLLVLSCASMGLLFYVLSMLAYGRKSLDFYPNQEKKLEEAKSELAEPKCISYINTRNQDM